jgi:cytoskeletal protein RodZ
MAQANDLGEIFKSRRQEVNLTLKEVENATSIRMSYLRAIEDGELMRVISPVYAQGFVRQYALFLGLDGDSIIQEFSQHFSKSVKQEFSYGIGTLEVRGSPGAGVKWLPNLGWLTMTAGVLLLAWYVAKALQVI